ncbi:uncharacterized protein LOC136093163 [Hydra vulgaris]|uniref:uncharacterized protein LOC136093163 n=1 Tax=Hydra vulgaris TaxID=6087 RepID=UPI0032EA51B9
MASKKEIEIIMEEKFKAQESSLLKIVSENGSIQNDKMDKILHSIENITNRISKVEKKTTKLAEIIDGVRENEKETWGQTEKKVQQIFNDQLKISNIIIERAHRIERRCNAEKIKNKPRTIILKLLNYKDKEKILENAKMLKGTGIFINIDFSFETNKIRRELSEKMKIERNAGKYAIIEYDKLIVREFNLKAK